MAAVVGLAGGFLFTWLLSRRGEVIVERRRYIDWLNRIIAELEGLRRRTDTVRLQTDDVLRKIRDQHVAGVSHDRLEIPRFELLSHNAYQVPHPSVDDIAALEQLPPLYEQLRGAIINDRGKLACGLLSLKPLEARGLPAYREVEIRHDPFEKTGIGPENFWSGIRMQKDYAIWKWQEVAREYDRLAFELKTFRERLVPGSIYFLILVLFGLVGAGVVAPMAFLSAHAGFSKWVLFAISAPLVVAFVGYLAYEVRRLRQAADLARDTI